MSQEAVRLADEVAVAETATLQGAGALSGEQAAVLGWLLTMNHLLTRCAEAAGASLPHFNGHPFTSTLSPTVLLPLSGLQRRRQAADMILSPTLAAEDDDTGMVKLRDRFLELSRQGLALRLAASGNATWKSFFLDSGKEGEEATVQAGERNGGLLSHLLGADHPLVRADTVTDTRVLAPLRFRSCSSAAVTLPTLAWCQPHSPPSVPHCSGEARSRDDRGCGGEARGADGGGGLARRRRDPGGEAVRGGSAPACARARVGHAQRCGCVAAESGPRLSQRVALLRLPRSRRGVLQASTTAGAAPCPVGCAFLLALTAA